MTTEAQVDRAFQEFHYENAQYVTRMLRAFRGQMKVYPHKTKLLRAMAVHEARHTSWMNGLHAAALEDDAKRTKPAVSQWATFTMPTDHAVIRDDTGL